MRNASEKDVRANENVRRRGNVVYNCGECRVASLDRRALKG